MWKDKHLDKITLKNIVLLITYTIFLVFVILHSSSVLKFLSMVFSLLKPFIYGFIFAFMLNIPMRFFIKKINFGSEKFRKILAGICSIVCIVCLLMFIISIVLPQFIESTTSLLQEFPSYAQSSEKMILTWMHEFGLDETLIEQYNRYSAKLEESFLNLFSSILPAIVSLTGNILSTLSDMVMAIVIAIYFTLSKDVLITQIKKVLYVFLPKRTYEYLCSIFVLSNKTFSAFISGQLIEAIIIGVLCYVGAIVLNFPYAPILSVIIACTNFIPIFGAIVGTLLCAMLLLFVNPWQAFLFLLFGIVLQQFEANLIYPKVVGNSVGLSGMWVLLAVSIGGGLFGFGGLVFGLPAFAVIYRLFADYVNAQSIKKKVKNVE